MRGPFSGQLLAVVCAQRESNGRDNDARTVHTGCTSKGGSCSRHMDICCSAAQNGQFLSKPPLSPSATHATPLPLFTAGNSKRLYATAIMQTEYAMLGQTLKHAAIEGQPVLFQSRVFTTARWTGQPNIHHLQSSCMHAKDHASRSRHPCLTITHGEGLDLLAVWLTTIT
jgi:hypothetical protein